MPRLKKLAYEEMDADQRNAHDEILAGPRTSIAGPMNAWFRSPGLAGVSQKLGAFCRFETSLPPRLSEFAILIVARHWTAQIEWFAHQPLAIKGGLSEAVTDALARRQRPEFENRDEEVLFEFSTELVEQRSVSDETYGAALAEFGEKTLVELIGILGYYTYVAMVLNSFQEMPDGAPPLAE